MNDTFHSSDGHWGHANISRLAGRPFPHGPDGVEEMNEHLVERWNATVGPTDTTWMHGDVAMGRIEESLAYIARLNGTIHLIVGNHDRCWPHYKGYDAAKVDHWRRRYLDAGFASICDSATLATEQITTVTPNHAGVLMTHFPYTGESPSHFEDRYADQRPHDDGGWLIHGHVHEAWRQRGRQINVGVDAWNGRPVSTDEIAELIAAGPRDLGPLEWVR
jgi:calcineurin-like phosphoesterase family protein